MNYQKKNHYNTYNKTSKPPPKHRLDKPLAMFAAVFLLAPYMYFQLYGYVENGAAFAAPCLAALTLGLGYAAQVGYAKLRKYRRIHMDDTYENTEQLFEPSHASGPFVLAVLLMAAVFIAAKIYLRWRVNAGIDQYYDNNALFPFFLAPTCTVFMALGAVSWFYPAKWMISIRLLIPAVASIVLCFVFTKYIYKISLTFYIVSMVIALACVLLSHLLTRYYASFMKRE